MRCRMLLPLFLAFSLMGQDIVVIVNPESGVQKLSQEEVKNIFLGRQKRISERLVALPVEQVEPSELRTRFYKALVGKDVAEINAYWARLYFSGEAQPPHRARSAQEVLDIVAANKGAVGLVEKDQVDRRVRVVFWLKGSQ